MLLQVLSDLHLETEAFDPEPASGADVLVLAGDIDSTWRGYARFADWPVPVLVVAGNHEFDRRELRQAWPAFREMCGSLGLRLLEQDECILTGRDGRPIRFLGTVRWSDFDLFGPEKRDKAIKAAGYFQKVMDARCDGEPFDANAVRREGLRNRAWLQERLRAGPLEAQVSGPAQASGEDPRQPQATVVITHFAPSARSADPRYGMQPGTASFCNADDDLLEQADLWIHGHLHLRHDYTVPRGQAGGPGPRRPGTRVICQARGLARKGEAQGHDPLMLFPV